MVLHISADCYATPVFEVKIKYVDGSVIFETSTCAQLFTEVPCK